MLKQLVGDAHKRLVAGLFADRESRHHAGEEQPMLDQDLVHAASQRLTHPVAGRLAVLPDGEVDGVERQLLGFGLHRVAVCLCRLVCAAVVHQGAQDRHAREQPAAACAADLCRAGTGAAVPVGGRLWGVHSGSGGRRRRSARRAGGGGGGGGAVGLSARRRLRLGVAVGARARPGRARGDGRRRHQGARPAALLLLLLLNRDRTDLSVTPQSQTQTD